MRVEFHPLGGRPLESVLPPICEAVLAQGARLLVVAGEPLLARLDRMLWTYAPDSFLAHGRERPEIQPILLSTDMEAANGATAVAIADGRWHDEALRFDQAYYLFDDSAREAARSAWRSLKDRSGVELRHVAPEGAAR